MFLNGKSIESFTYSSFISVILGEVELPAKGKTLDVTLAVNTVDESAVLKFKITRHQENVDIPANQLIIREVNVINKSDVLVALCDGTSPEFEGAEPTNVEIRCPKNLMSSVKVNDATCEVKSAKDANGTAYWYALEK